MQRGIPKKRVVPAVWTALLAATAVAATWAAAVPTGVSPSLDPTVETATPPRDARSMVLAWADAWSRQSVGDYFAFYARTFQPQHASSRTAWQAERRERIERPRWIEVTLEEIHVMVRNALTEVTFVQTYRSDGFQDAVNKRLVLTWEDESWKIRSEEVLLGELADR